MTEEELDLLASAHVDGETTSDEVVMIRDVVEADPDLADRFTAKVEALQAISGRVGDVPTPPTGLKDQQLAAALALFDEIKPTEGQVLDLEARAKALKTADSMNRARHVRVGRMPQWLPSAAVFLLIGGGLIFVVANFNGGSDDSTADVAASFDESSTEAGSDDATTESADLAQGDSDAGAETRAATSEDDAGDAAGGLEEESGEDEEAMEDSAEDDEAMEETAEAEAAPTSTTGTDPVEPVPGGFFPEEPAVIYSETPDLGEVAANLEELPDLFDPELSGCVGAVEVAETSVLAGYLPVEVAGDPAELFIIFDDAGARTAVLLATASCLPIS